MTDSIKPGAQTLHCTINLNPPSPVPVYRRINGELVRIPNDARDPKRRYTMTHDGNRQYLVEFTDEEEREHDKLAADWEAGAPQREAERLRQEEDRKKFVDSLVYEERIVAFIEVLGWATALKRSTTDPDLTKNLGIAVSHLTAFSAIFSFQQEHGFPSDPRVTQFSDSVVISFAANSHAQSSLEMTISQISHSLFNLGYLVRGGVSMGRLIHKDNMVYGPALVDAYFHESQYAKFPRIILNEELADAWGRGASVSDRQGNFLGFQTRWGRDQDGFFFFDYLGDPFGIRGPRLDASCKVPVEFMTRWHKFITEKLAENIDNPRTLIKYLWLTKYFNRICSEDSKTNHEIVRLPKNWFVALVRCIFSRNFECLVALLKIKTRRTGF